MKIGHFLIQALKRQARFRPNGRLAFARYNLFVLL